jgi:transcriptional regulator
MSMKPNIERPWSLGEAQAHAERLAEHILGFELEVESIEGKFKLSQNRSDGDRAGVLKELAKSRDSGVQEILELMRGLYEKDGRTRNS